MNKNDGFSAIALLALGFFGVIKGLQLPLGTFRAPDTAFFPVVLSSLLILLSLILLGRSLRVRRIEQGGVHFGERWKRLIVVVPAFVAYFFLLEPIGYVLTTVAMIILVAKLVNCSWKEAVAISIVCTVVTYILIVRYLNGPLPKGIIPF